MPTIVHGCDHSCAFVGASPGSFVPAHYTHTHTQTHTVVNESLATLGWVLALDGERGDDVEEGGEHVIDVVSVAVRDESDDLGCILAGG